MNSVFQAKTVVNINAWNNPCVGVGITYTSQVGLRAFYKPCSKKFGSISGHPYQFNIKNTGYDSGGCEPVPCCHGVSLRCNDKPYDAGSQIYGSFLCLAQPLQKIKTFSPLNVFASFDRSSIRLL